MDSSLRSSTGLHSTNPTENNMKPMSERAGTGPVSHLPNNRKRPISMLSGSSVSPTTTPQSLPSSGIPFTSQQFHEPTQIPEIKRDPYGDSANSKKPFNSVNKTSDLDFSSNEDSTHDPTPDQPYAKKSGGPRKRRTSSPPGMKSTMHNSSKNQNLSNIPLSPPSNAGDASAVYRARPVRSCTHCRQQKIRCNALETFPAPCTRCAKMGRKCVVDPFFKPQKGGQVQSLRDDISSLKQQLAMLQRKSSNGSPETMEMSLSPTLSVQDHPSPTFQSPDSQRLPGGYGFPAAQHRHSLDNDPRATRSSDHGSPSESPCSTSSLHHHATSLDPLNQSYNNADMDSNSRVLSGDSLPNKQHNPKHLHKLPGSSHRSILSTNGHFLLSDSASSVPNLHQTGSVPISTIISQDLPPDSSRSSPPLIDTNRPGDKVPEDHIHSRQASATANSSDHSDYIMGDVRLPYEKAEELHHRFMTNYLPFLPIIQSNSAAELYRQSQLLFWTVCLTASLSEPVPTLYNSLSMLIKQLAIETCWIQTPRSTHIVQALLILGNWPLPNEKVLDDCSYRFVTLAKALAMQLGLHRGKFIYEFSRTQVSLPDAEKWRTRTWISIFIAEQVWCANLGLPPNMPMDYLLEESRTDTSLPKPFRSLACLAMFCSKLVNLLGSSVTSPDGTLEPKNRFSTLGILEQELDRLVTEMGNEDGKYSPRPYIFSLTTFSLG